MSRGEEQEQSQGAVRDQQAEHSAEHAEGQAFHQKLACDLAPARAQRSPDGEFLLASVSADQKEICHVRTGDQQNHADGAHQDPQDAADVADQFLFQGTQFLAETRFFEHPDGVARKYRELVESYRDHASHIGTRLLDGDAGFEPRDSAISEVPEEDFIAIETHWQNESRLRAKEPEMFGHDADDLFRASVDDDAAADRVRIAAESGLPV